MSQSMNKIFFSKIYHREKKTEFKNFLKRWKNPTTKAVDKTWRSRDFEFYSKVQKIRPLTCILIFLSGFQTRLFKTLWNFLHNDIFLQFVVPLMWYQYYCINYRAALKADIGTQVVADDPYFGGKVSFLKFLLTLIQTISFNSSH